MLDSSHSSQDLFGKIKGTEYMAAYAFVMLKMTHMQIADAVIVQRNVSLN